MKGGAKVIVEPHRHEGIFIAKQKEDVLVTRNMVVGESVYGEKRISVEQGDQKIEYRVWNPFRWFSFFHSCALQRVRVSAPLPPFFPRLPSFVL
jgi:hypothetical protein